MLCSCILSLFSCQQADYSYDETPQGNLDALWTLIDERYCFLSYKEEQLGFKWSELHAKYSAKLNPKMSRVQLFEVLCQMLSELKDGHVNISTSLDLGRNWSWKEDYPENLDTELRQRYLGTDYHIGSGLKYTILPDNIAYVVYESFSDAIGEGNLSDMLSYLQLSVDYVLAVLSVLGQRLFAETPLLVLQCLHYIIMMSGVYGSDDYCFHFRVRYHTLAVVSEGPDAVFRGKIVRGCRNIVAYCNYRRPGHFFHDPAAVILADGSAAYYSYLKNLVQFIASLMVY